MELGLEEKVAIVTGASKGIGRAVALELAREGAQIVANARNQEGLDKAAAAIKEATGRDIHTIAGDMTKSADITRMVEETVSRFGRVDILIANAGISVRGDILEIPDADTYYDLDLSLMGLKNCCRAVIPHMQKNGGGRIVIMAAKAGMEPILHIPLTSAVNAAQINLGKGLARLYAQDGILVNTINLGAIWTELAEESTAVLMKETGKSYEELKAQRGRHSALNRNGTPEEVSGLVAFLCSERATFITGAAIEVDGAGSSYI